ncbi:MAG: hypothetical protein WCW44_00300 [archaeon]|jgi:predicted RNA-binding protein with PUA domain
MKIAFCASMAFAKEMIEIKNKLEQKGHTIILPHNTEKYASGKWDAESKSESVENKKKYDLINKYFEVIKNSDAILIINHKKNNIPNYIGGNGLIEIAFAHVLGKKIFLLNPIPEISYSDEIKAMSPIVLNGRLEEIK